MSLRNTLNRLIRVVIEEAERNPDFEAALTDALDSASSRRKSARAESPRQVDANEAKRGKNRRAPAVLDPVQVARDSESGLRSALEKLSLDQLRDIVAEYGMDPGRLVMKWNTPERVIERIVEMSVARAHKGNAFRKSPDDPAPLATDVDETPPFDAQVVSDPPKGS
ncbi:TPA: hypothetical protein UM349_002386 [Stenotrophomonas maltophilia]|nr:hypothetical protein K7564_01325 [Stenotrophomonas maltophilia]HEL4117127.1 hypothetical protein [Stenotrophomonas maltophilia]